MFTKQHYEAIAKCIRPVYQQVLEDSITADKLNVVSDIVQKLSELFSEDNDNFNPDTFTAFITE